MLHDRKAQEYSKCCSSVYRVKVNSRIQQLERPECSHQRSQNGLVNGLLGTCVLRVQRSLNSEKVEGSCKEEVIELTLED